MATLHDDENKEEKEEEAEPQEAEEPLEEDYEIKTPGTVKQNCLYNFLENIENCDKMVSNIFLTFLKQMIAMTVSMQSFGHDQLTTTSNETFIQNFQVILKCRLQKY